MKGYIKKFIIGVILIILSIGLFLFVKLYAIQQQFQAQTGLTPKTTLSLIFDGGAPLKTHNNRINILLLEIGGGTHEGADLTDTMIVASISEASPSMKLISIPRDIWSEDLKDRINSAYHYGEAIKKGNGLIRAKTIVESVVGFPIQYSLVFDFSGFKKIIDLVGGIDVVVTKPFTDSEYPISGKENDVCNGDIMYKCRYETIQFASGSAHMDGDLALKYVRSRHAEGDEGTDFARGERQQEIIIGLKQKILALKPWYHPSFFLQLIQAVDEASDMDMSIAEVLTLAKYVYLMNETAIQKISIEPLLRMGTFPEFDRYVLVPTKNFSAIHEFIQQELVR